MYNICRVKATVSLGFPGRRAFILFHVEKEIIMSNVSEYFGSLVFDDRVMKESLSADIYAKLRKTIDEGERLDLSVANAVADAVKAAEEKDRRL